MLKIIWQITCNRLLKKNSDLKVKYVKYLLKSSAIVSRTPQVLPNHLSLVNDSRKVTLAWLHPKLEGVVAPPPFFVADFHQLKFN